MDLNFDAYEKTLQEAKSAQPSEVLTFDKLEKILGKRDGKWIYVFQAPNTIDTDIYTNVKTLKTNLAFARLNTTNGLSTTLYVGSSNSLIPRLNQHFGFGPKQTYSMKMNEWFEGTFTVTAYRFNVSQEALQLIEDTLWNAKLPVLGKKGAK